MCALTARTFGQRPSTMLGITDPVVAYAVDEALALRLALLRQTKRQPLPGEYYERPPVEPYDPQQADQALRDHLEQLRREGRLTETAVH